MKFVDKKCEFMLPSGLGQGKLVAINLFNIVKPFSLGVFLDFFEMLVNLKVHSLVCA